MWQEMKHQMRTRKAAAVVAIVICLGVLIGFGLPAVAGSSKYAAVKAVSLTLRERASTSSDAITSIPEGGIVTILRRSGSDSDWMQVTYGSKSGYVMEKYLRYDVTDKEVAKAKAAKKSAKAAVVKVDIDAPVRLGDEGDEVEVVQKALKSKGYAVATDGVFGQQTDKAVKKFQEVNGLSKDGIVGDMTVKKLNSSSAKTASSKTSKSNSAIELVSWWDGGSSIWEIGTVATITDVETGISWKEKRLGGSNHNDTEPLTADDTAKMKKVYGEWSWERRAVIVQVGDRRIAASMNGMPHGSQNIDDNNFNGHHCIHFYKSRTHKHNYLCPKHQAMVMKAYNSDK